MENTQLVSTYDGPITGQKHLLRLVLNYQESVNLSESRVTRPTVGSAEALLELDISSLSCSSVKALPA